MGGRLPLVLVNCGAEGDLDLVVAGCLPFVDADVVVCGFGAGTTGSTLAGEVL